MVGLMLIDHGIPPSFFFSFNEKEKYPKVEVREKKRLPSAAGTANGISYFSLIFQDNFFRLPQGATPL